MNDEIAEILETAMLKEVASATMYRKAAAMAIRTASHWQEGRAAWRMLPSS